jgi:hypothetical protein
VCEGCQQVSFDGSGAREAHLKKARRDHTSFLSIIKSGAAALTIARKEKVKAGLNLKRRRPPLQTGPTTISSSFPRSIQMKSFNAWRMLERRVKRPLRSWRSTLLYIMNQSTIQHFLMYY